jgi:hypothetical protein
VDAIGTSFHVSVEEALSLAGSLRQFVLPQENEVRVLCLTKRRPKGSQLMRQAVGLVGQSFLFH